MEMTGSCFKRVHLKLDPKEVWGATLDHNARWFLVDTTVLGSTQIGLCLLQGTLMLWVEKGTELPWDCTMLGVLDRTEKVSCSSDLMKSTVKCRVGAVLFPRSCGEVMEQCSKSE